MVNKVKIGMGHYTHETYFMCICNRLLPSIRVNSRQNENQDDKVKGLWFNVIWYTWASQIPHKCFASSFVIVGVWFHNINRRWWKVGAVYEKLWVLALLQQGEHSVTCTTAHFKDFFASRLRNDGSICIFCSREWHWCESNGVTYRWIKCTEQLWKLQP